MREKADCYNKLFEKRSVCMTGGLDTRVVLAAMISKQEKSSIISWQGRGHVFNSQLEDREFVVKIFLKNVDYHLRQLNLSLFIRCVKILYIMKEWGNWHLFMEEIKHINN